MKRSRRHALGQHFLSQPGILDKIVRLVDPRPEEVVLEVGPGRGDLTALLAARAGWVVGVEKDPRLVPALRDRGLPRTTIVQADILEVDWGELLAETGKPGAPAKLVGNIPYAISSPLLDKVFESRRLFKLCVLLLQKEFAQRLAAEPGSRKYAPLSFLLQRFFVVRRHFSVSAGAFHPPPRVESEAVSLAPRPAPEHPVDDEPLLAGFVRAGFAERRKTLANNLGRLGLSREAIQAAMAALGLNLKVRAEQVPADSWVSLFDRLGAPGLGALSRRHPGRRQRPGG